MKKTLVMFLVASLLLAGCTELTSSDDGETMNIEVNEDIALEKINDFVTVDEDESFGITLMYEIDASSMSDEMMDLGEDAVIIMEMTEAWSPDGYHTSSVMGMDDGGVIISMASSVTHIGNNIYMTIEYEIDGELGADATDEESAEFAGMVAMMPEPESFSMVSATTHTEVIAAMAEETADNSDGMDPMAMLEMIEMIEAYGQFTPAESVDGLQMFDATLDMAAMMADEIPTPDEALERCDIDGNGGISWTELTTEECDGPDEDGGDDGDLEALFNDADTDSSGELTIDELQDFIDAVTAFYDDEEDMSDDDMEMPPMKVAFTSTGDIEYFSMDMDEAELMMYILSESRVDEIFTDVDAGELVALPFTISDELDPWGYDDEFYCDDGSAIPMSYVNDGYEDCADGEDEMGMDGHDDDHDDHDHGDHGDDDHGDHGGDDHDDHDHGDHGDDDHDDHGDDDLIFYDGCTESDDPADSPLECWMNDWVDSDGEIMMSDGYEMDDCTELSDNTGWECESRGDHSVEITFICGDGTEIPFEYVNDDEEDCDDGADEQQYNETGEEINWFDCMDGSQVWITQVNDGVEDCADGDDEMPDMDEPHGDDHDDDFYCDDGSTIPMSWVNDGYADCTDGEDEDDSDHDDGSDSGDAEFYITINDAMIPFEGDMNDYSIELASCEEDIDWDTGETIKDCTTQMTVSIADAMEIGSPVVFHDADSSGTISDGDMIHISALLVVDYDEVRLYSSSADAYSDENPVFEMPGFTGVVGVLALLGAALLRRKA